MATNSWNDPARRPEFWRPVVMTALFTMPFAGLVGFWLAYHRRIPPSGIPGILLAGLVVGVVLGLLIGIGTSRAADRLVRMITADGGLPPARSFSYEESLVARGRAAEARAEYEGHLRRNPADIDALLALAALHRDHLGARERALEVFLDARKRRLNRAQELAVSNALIDLYRAAGERGREMAELSRLAQRFAGAEAGERAGQALRRLKRESP